MLERVEPYLEKVLKERFFLKCFPSNNLMNSLTPIEPQSEQIIHSSENKQEGHSLLEQREHENDSGEVLSHT